MAPYQPKAYGKWSFNTSALQAHKDAISAIKAKQYAELYGMTPEPMNPVSVGYPSSKKFEAPMMTTKMEHDAEMVQKGDLLGKKTVSVLPIIKWWHSYDSSVTENPKKREAELKLLRAVGEFAHVCQCAGEEVQFLGEIHEYLKHKPTTQGHPAGNVVQPGNNADGIYGPTSAPTPNPNPAPQVTASTLDDF